MTIRMIEGASAQTDGGGEVVGEGALVLTRRQ